MQSLCFHFPRPSHHISTYSKGCVYCMLVIYATSFTFDIYPACFPTMIMVWSIQSPSLIDQSVGNNETLGYRCSFPCPYPSHWSVPVDWSLLFLHTSKFLPSLSEIYQWRYSIKCMTINDVHFFLVSFKWPSWSWRISSFGKASLQFECQARVHHAWLEDSTWLTLWISLINRIITQRISTLTFILSMVLCKFFQEGRCNRGNSCNFEHVNPRSQSDKYK